MSIGILLSGDTGAIGRLVEHLADSDPDLEITGRASRSAFFTADDAGDVVVDFSAPTLCAESLGFALDRGIAMVIGTTGLEDKLQETIRAAAGEIAIFQAANFSIGVNLLLQLSVRAAEVLGEDFDIEILEAHHRRKVDAPSGTALALGERLAAARGLDPDSSAVFDRSNRRRPRPAGEIGYHAVRGGDVAGEHTVFFLGDGERLELTHRATDRRIFAAGALKAARWVVDQPPGLYGMEDLLGKA